MRAGVDPGGQPFHIFRHTFSTLLEELPGVSYTTIRRLRRDELSSTDMADRYIHVTEERLRAALAALEAKVLPPANVVHIQDRKSVA